MTAVRRRLTVSNKLAPFIGASLVAVESVEIYTVVTVASVEFIPFQGSRSKSNKDLGKRVCKESSHKLVKV